MNYCDYCLQPNTKDIHIKYHNSQYGFPIDDDNKLFGRLILEINQAGLSWETILNKENNFKLAYSKYDIETVASYTDFDIKKLLSNKGIVRNKLKINAVIYNAQKLLDIKNEYGSFNRWLDLNHPLKKDDWVKLFKKTFKFVGREIVSEFLMSIGYLPGAHKETCPVYKKIEKLKPKWKEK
ncbi:MAG: DNA-3-methyladenine glycosylase [Crocinitomicaceae bacterium]|nr:DNA-3-methyladenine glycosylase [Crocinitomicaceae bacterium]|tara:strand:+ start:29583 stop:30125 length:543 start_codon:yes stop_codon:yes gene_type:complete